MKKSMWFIITGSGIILCSTAGLIYHLWFFTHFYTPLMWSGYILLLDGINYSIAGHSLIISRTREFIWMAVLSIFFWYIFEFYNLFIQNWYYINLPENRFIRYIGYFWSFATIWPGVLETFEFIRNIGIFRKVRIRPIRIPNLTLYFILLIGLIASITPFVLPFHLAKYTAVLVWVGPVLILDPVLYLRGKPSLLREWENGSISLMLQLFLAGAVCGFWWEFWNFWATTKWKYSVPFGPDLYIFEMPVIGFLGFLPFAVEIFLMWELTKDILKLK